MIGGKRRYADRGAPDREVTRRHDDPDDTLGHSAVHLSNLREFRSTPRQMLRPLCCRSKNFWRPLAPRILASWMARRYSAFSMGLSTVRHRGFELRPSTGELRPSVPKPRASNEQAKRRFDDIVPSIHLIHPRGSMNFPGRRRSFLESRRGPRVQAFRNIDDLTIRRFIGVKMAPRSCASDALSPSGASSLGTEEPMECR